WESHRKLSSLPEFAKSLAGFGWSAVPMATFLSELDRQVSIIESKGPSDDDDGLAEACASLDLLLEKQSTIESLLNLRADEMNAIDKMYTMCMQAESMGGEIIAVANSIRSMRVSHGRVAPCSLVTYTI
ncbi:hypothetical protein FOL47_010345, partial [Perkinsus chesapeaki]